MRYVDGYVLPIRRKNLPAYARMARRAARVWRDHGALDYKECIGDDLKTKYGVPFPRLMKVKPGETVVFSYIVFKSRKHRDRVNARVMRDPRLAEYMDSAAMPFDLRRMAVGGFKGLVEA